MIGAKKPTEVRDTIVRSHGRGASYKQRRWIVRSVGAYRSENADISSESPDKNSGCRKSKVSPAMSIIRGSIESNPMPRGYRGCTNR